MFDKQQIKSVYRKRARRYDISANAYRLLGFRELYYRKRAVRGLALSEGNTVVELGCGTGLNFPLLQRAVGDTGRIIGVDMSPDMLAEARRRMERNGWRNVQLVECDVARYDFPPRTDGVMSSFAVTMVPEYDEVIRRAAKALGQHKRMAILELGLPDWPRWVIRTFDVILLRPFGGSLDMAQRHPWKAMEKYFQRVRIDSFYFGAVYIAAGTN